MDFLHKTVRDFLMEKDMHQDLIQHATDNNATHWDPYQALCLVELARAKALHLKDKMQKRLNVLFSLVDALMFYAHQVEIQQKEPQTGLLDQLDQMARIRWSITGQMLAIRQRVRTLMNAMTIAFSH